MALGAGYESLLLALIGEGCGMVSGSANTRPNGEYRCVVGPLSCVSEWAMGY